jgi:hypothetical protein
VFKSNSGEMFLVKYFRVALLAKLMFLILFCVPAIAQDTGTPAEVRPTPTPAGRGATPTYTAEQIVESVILIYAFPGGRNVLNQIRRTTFERGRLTVTAENGSATNANYQRWIIRGDSLDKDKVKFEQDFPNARYSLIHSEDKVWGEFGNTSFVPRDDATQSFKSQIYRSIDALLRYKENGAEIINAGTDRIMGVDYHLIDLTDSSGLKTRFFVSQRTFRVMMLEYEEGGVEYRRRFYDYRIAQGTLVPYRSVLWAGDKIVEESNVNTITFGQRVDEGLFASRN